MLRITKQADYGIVLMTHMAGEPERQITAGELAIETRLPAPTVSKVLKMLARQGLLGSHRGVKGGYCLARDERDQLLRDAAQVNAGERISLALHRGSVEATVERTNPGPKDPGRN